MRFKLLIAFMLMVLLACSDDNSNPTYPLERTVLGVSIAQTGKDSYVMRWNHPIERQGLQSYYVWLDTTVVKDSVQKVSDAQINHPNTIVINYKTNSDGDSLDLTKLIEEFLERDSLHIAIWAKYSGNDQGIVQHLHIYFGDNVRPSVVSFKDSASTNTIWIDWLRPTDQSNFYKSDSIDGPIAGYNISIRTEDQAEDIRNIPISIYLAGVPANSNLIRSARFVKDGRSVKWESVNDNDQRYLRLAIIDGKRFTNDNAEMNTWRMQISGLRPEHSYRVIITAYDSAGNVSNEESRNIKTTDNRAPSIASKFWYYLNPQDNLARLDSNRLILFWVRSQDTLNDRSLKPVKGYTIEHLSNNAWESIPRLYTIKADYYNATYIHQNDSMIANPHGAYISDTLRWVLPGDTVILRMWAIDSSGHYSKEMRDTIAISMDSLRQYKCPPNFAPVKIDEENIVCMERLQHNSGGKFEKNILYIKADSICKAKNYRLCTEQEWNAACNSRGSSYGVIEEKNESGFFSASDFLYLHCGVGTGDSISAINANKRNKICASPDGIWDLPGQLQEWVTSSENTPLLKGSSYAVFQGASREELALCRNRFTPTRIRPRYTTDSVYLYRTGSRIDTLLARDTLRTPYAILKPDSLPDTLLFYTLKDSNNTVLGEDYVNQAEYRKRNEDKWLNVLWQGLKYEFKEPKQVLITGDTAINASKFFLDPTVGFRCCTENFSILPP